MLPITSRRYSNSTYLGYTLFPGGKLMLFNSAHAQEQEQRRAVTDDVLSLVLDGVMNGACSNPDFWALLSGWSKKRLDWQPKDKASISQWPRIQIRDQVNLICFVVELYPLLREGHIVTAWNDAETRVTRNLPGYLTPPKKNHLVLTITQANEEESIIQASLCTGRGEVQPKLTVHVDSLQF